MEKKIKILNDVFELELTENDLNKEIEKVLPWDSFHIMEFLAEIEERYNKRITIEQISRVKKICDLLNLIESK